MRWCDARASEQRSNNSNKIESRKKVEYGCSLRPARTVGCFFIVVLPPPQPLATAVPFQSINQSTSDSILTHSLIHSMLLGSRKRPSSDDSTDSEQHKRTRHEHEPGELAAVSSTCELSDLPNELLLHILSFIPEVQYATAVSSVCRRWYRLYLASRRSLTLATARNEPAASNRGDGGAVALVSEGRSVLLRMLASCPQLREIDTADVHIVDSDVAAMAEQHPRLRRLTLFSCNRLTDSSLASISHFQRLRALTMRFALCIPATAWHSLLRQRSFVCSLESFSSTLAQIDDEAVEAFVHNASPERLSSLHLSVCTLVTGASLALLALHHPQLKSLDFPAPHATDAQLTLMCAHDAPRAVAALVGHQPHVDARGLHVDLAARTLPATRWQRACHRVDNRRAPRGPAQAAAQH